MRCSAKVIAGFEVVDAIKVVKTKAGDVPVETVTITSAKVVSKEEAEKASKPAEKAPAAGGEEKKVEEKKGGAEAEVRLGLELEIE